MEILLAIYVAISLGIAMKYSLENMRLNDGWSIRDSGESRTAATKKLLYISTFGGAVIGWSLLQDFGQSMSKSLKRFAN